jgi:hypothetical protein
MIGISVLALVLVANLVVSPIDPLMQQSPGLGAGYDVGYLPDAGLGDASAMVRLMPPGSTVLTSDDLFPLVANDPHAYVLLEGSYLDFRHLPFGPSQLPAYLLIAQNRLSEIPSWLASTLYNGSHYAVLAVTWSTAAGAIVLFGTEALSPVRYYGPTPASSQQFDATSLHPGLNGRLFGAAHPSSSTIGSLPGNTGTLWSGPRLDLPPGQYEANVTVSCWLWGLSSPPDNRTPTLQLHLGAFGQSPWVKSVLPWSAFPLDRWTTLHLNFTVTHPSIDSELSGTILSIYAEMFVSSVSFLRLSST